MIDAEPSLLDSTPEGVDPTTGEMFAPVVEGEGEKHDPIFLRNRLDTLEKERKALANDLQYAERDMRALRRRIMNLEEQLEDQKQEAPEAQVIQAIYRRWLHRTGRNPKRTKLGKKRRDTVLARLRENIDAELLLRAVDGAALAANTSNSETQRIALLASLKRATDLLATEHAAEVRSLYAEQMRNVVVYDDLELICRNEVNVERFAAIADRIDPLPPVEDDG